jgi:hypothetical protein
MAVSIERLIEDDGTTLAQLRAYTKDSGGRTLLRWNRHWGAHDHKEALVVCATNEAEIEALLDALGKAWGTDCNAATMRA